MEPGEATSPAGRERRLALARGAFREFRVQCFWFWNDDLPIEERDIPGIVQGLREYGGHKGYRIVAQLCP